MIPSSWRINKVFKKVSKGYELSEHYNVLNFLSPENIFCFPVVCWVVNVSQEPVLIWLVLGVISSHRCPQQSSSIIPHSRIKSDETTPGHRKNRWEAITPGPLLGETVISFVHCLTASETEEKTIHVFFFPVKRFPKVHI